MPAGISTSTAIKRLNVVTHQGQRMNVQNIINLGSLLIFRDYFAAICWVFIQIVRCGQHLCGIVNYAKDANAVE
ncbi:hypothetical protein, partial [Staphylococcus pasteuri_A]